MGGSVVGSNILRLWVLVLLEVATFTGTAGALLASARMYHSHFGAPETQVRRPLHNRGDLLFPNEEVGISHDAVGTFLGMDDDVLVKRLQSAEVKSLRFNRGGSSVSFRVEFKDGGRAAFKPLQINPQSVPRKEVAAYRMNRLLGLNLIAPAILRTFGREDILGKLSGESASMRPRVEAETTFDNGATTGVLQYWIPNIANLGLDSAEGVNRWSEWLSIGTSIPADKVHLMQQFSTLLLFDLMQNNSDRFSGGNLMGSPDGKSLFFMDNAFGFQTDPEGHQRCRSYLYRAQKFSRRFVTAIRKLDRDTLVETMKAEPAPLLSEAEIEAVLGRRDQALKHVDALIAQHGEGRVLVFP